MGPRRNVPADEEVPMSFRQAAAELPVLLGLACVVAMFFLI